MLVLSAADVESIVSGFESGDLQLLMAHVFSQFYVCSTRGNMDARLAMPQRLSFPILSHTALFMPARISGLVSSNPNSLPTSALKVACVPYDSQTTGIPATTLVLDENTGSVKAIVNARKLTALRNAAGSLLSTSLLAISQPESLVAFGAGQQIESHLDLHFRHFPSLKHCTIVNRTRNDRALSLRKKISDKFSGRGAVVELIVHDQSRGDTHHRTGSEVKRALGLADLIICATSATVPLFPSSYVKKGSHIILVGSYKPDMKEVDRDLISRSLKGTLLVDSKDACLREAGELIDSSVQPGDMKELGELLPTDARGELDIQALNRMLDKHRPRKTARSSDGPVTLFKSVGLGIQDVAIAAAVVQKALDSNEPIGTVIPKYDSDI